MYTDPKTGTVYTSPEVAKQNGAYVPEGLSSGVSIEQQTREANAKLPGSTVTSTLPGENPADLVNRISNGTTPTNTDTPAPVVSTSTSARMDEIKKAFNIGTPPVAPTTSPEDTTRLNKAKTERDTITTESEQIIAERAKLQEEWNNYKLTAGEGVSMGGMAGALDENGRKIQAKLDSLNTREAVLETKLSNRNNVISEIMNTQRQNYTDAVNTYNTQFSQALSLYSILDKQDDEIKTNAKASLDVLSSAYGAQMKAGQITELTGVQKAKLNELELQAGLPMGSTLAVIQSLKSDEEKLYSGVDDNGTFTLITKSANGEIKTQKIAGAVAPKPVSPGSPNSNTLPKGYPTAGQVDDWITKNKQANPNVVWYDLWGQLADELKQRGVNPTDFDKEFWKILHPEGLKGYEAEQKKKKKSGSSLDDMYNNIDNNG